MTAMRAAGITRPEAGDVITWDMMNIIVDAYRHLGTDATAAQLRDYINGIRNWPGIYGRIDFNETSPQRGDAAGVGDPRPVGPGTPRRSARSVSRAVPR